MKLFGNVECRKNNRDKEKITGKRDTKEDKSGSGAGFLRELRFPLPIYIPSASPQSSSLSLEAGTIGQEWPQCQ
jgi:hypothetical protein